MNDFERNPRRKFELRMRPVADKLYQQIMPEMLSIERFEKGDERHIWDRTFAIDCLFHFQELTLTCQEKFRKNEHLHYQDLTVEYYNDPVKREKGDWFNMCAQLYFCGYANATESAFDLWVLVDWSRLVMATIKGIVQWETRQNQYSKANFKYIKMAALPHDCLIRAGGL